MNFQTLDVHHMREALCLSEKCPPSNSAYAVGCVIVNAKDLVVATGFSREEFEYEHAEELAIRRALQSQNDLRLCTLFSTLEPCSVRLSKRKSCTERIIEHGIKRVVFALSEPETFVKCEGAILLRKAGVEVIILEDLAKEVRARIVKGHD